MATTTIEFQHVKKDFAGKTVIPDMSLKINEGELFVLVGTSGSGKTTSLKMINRLEEPTAGKIIVNGEDTQQTNLQHLRWQIGYVLQQIALFPTMTVAQNIAVIPDMQGTSRKSIDQTIDQLLNEVGLDPKVYRDRLPSELSGGEQQRIGILRALAAQPPIVLMDEPFSALDPISRTQLQDLVLKLHQQYHNTVVFVTHDMDEALKLGDRIGIMSKGELLQVDPPQELAQHPVNQFVADFFATSRAKNLYDVYLDRVGMLQGYLAAPADADETNTVELAGNATLRDAFKDLVSQPYIKVVRDHETLGWLDRQQILRFLSQHETA